MLVRGAVQPLVCFTHRSQDNVLRRWRISLVDSYTEPNSVTPDDNSTRLTSKVSPVEILPYGRCPQICLASMPRSCEPFACFILAHPSYSFVHIFSLISSLVLVSCLYITGNLPLQFLFSRVLDHLTPTPNISFLPSDPQNRYSVHCALYSSRLGKPP